ncbi:hypothetical protein NX059_003551 [Plenodomus lindquistii]|nr:hypothetical protein NX059_003551 [Plenodomus lindquistii]
MASGFLEVPGSPWRPARPPLIRITHELNRQRSEKSINANINANVNTNANANVSIKVNDNDNVNTKVNDTDNGNDSDSDNAPLDNLFACPYLKHDPDHYEERQSCSQSGWTSIHGVRQHVYRCHILPITCPNCSATFKSARLFSDHLKQSAECDHNLVEADEPILGLESLLAKIRTPNAGTGVPTEADMWKVMYVALFPEVSKNDAPSPYHEKDQAMIQVHTPFESPFATPMATPSLRPAGSPHPLVKQRGYFDSVIFPPSNTPPRVPTPVHSRPGTPLSDKVSRPGTPLGDTITRPAPAVIKLDQSPHGHASPFAEETLNIQQDSPSVPPSSTAGSSSKSTWMRKKEEKNPEFEVLGFRAWEKPQRTDEHITPGTYRGFFIGLARVFTFFIPSWFLKKVLKMNDLRERLGFRQKVLFCVMLFIIYAVLAWFLIIQPLLTCLIKVDIGLSEDGNFCAAVSGIIYLYMGLGGSFMLLVMVCVMIVRYKDREFEEHDALLILQMPCYNEDEETLRKTIDSCVDSSYEKKRKVLFIVADGTVAATGQKPTYKILLEDIFSDHRKDVEIGIQNLSHSYTSYDGDGHSENRAFTATGFYRDTPYVLVIKVGREDEQELPKPGNRGKRDSQLVTYNFFHYVNYRKMWTPLFENLEFKMRTHLNIDAREALYMLAIDCDTQVDKTGVSYLVDRLQRDHRLLGVCGYTGVGNGMDSFVACSQVFEYWLTHAVLKAVESVCANVFVLSGCFTIYRLKWPNNRPALLHPLLLEDYGGSYEKTLHEHNLLSIGEDRYLSTLAIRYFGADCRLQYFSAATCTTVVPTTLSVLLDQRRRWTNSLIHCHFAHLNVLPFSASPWTYIRIMFVLGAELFMVFVLPLALPAGLVLAIFSVMLTPGAWAILLAFSLIPVFLCVLCMDWWYIPYYLPFFPMIFMFSVVIPVYSLWNQDNFKWGKTRGG